MDVPRIVTPLGREPYNESERKCVEVFSTLRPVKSVWTRYEYGTARLIVVVDTVSERVLNMVQNAYADLVRWNDAINGTHGLASDNAAYWARDGVVILPSGQDETRRYIATMMPSCIWKRFDLFGPDGQNLGV